MSALGGAAAGGEGLHPVGTAIGLVILVIALALGYLLAPVYLVPLVLIVIGGLLIGFGVHFVPVGGAPAAMGQAPGIATGVAMLAGGAGLAGLFGGAWAASTMAVEVTNGVMSETTALLISIIGGGIGGGLMMAITCLFVNIIYVFGMGVPSASGKVAKDPITGDTFEAYKSKGTEGHGLPFISYVGGVIGGTLGGLGGTLIYYELWQVYRTAFEAPGTGFGAAVIDTLLVEPLAVALAGIFAIGLFLVNAVLSAYNITGTIEGPHDPKFKRVPRAMIGCAIASGVCGLLAILLVVPF